jgi:hypothetical protein
MNMPFAGSIITIADIVVFDGEVGFDDAVVIVGVDGTEIVVKCTWDAFCKQVAKFGYHINYIRNTITTLDGQIDPSSDKTDFELMFNEFDWYIEYNEDDFVDLSYIDQSPPLSTATKILNKVKLGFVKLSTWYTDFF